MHWNRREFLATTALATGAVALACAPTTKEIAKLTQSIIPVTTDAYFENNFNVSSSVIDRCLRELLSTGGQWGELYFENSRSVSVALSDGLVSRAGTSNGLGMGVRCTVGDQIGFAYTESLLPEDMLRAAKAAAAIAQNAEITPASTRKWLELKRYYDQKINLDNVSIADVVALLRATEAKTLAQDASITKVELSLDWKQSTVQINTSDGINASDSRPYFVFRIDVVMEKDGVTQSDGISFSEMNDLSAIDDQRIDEMIAEVVGNTRLLFDAIKPKGGEWPVVLGAGQSGILLHEAIGHGLEADFNRKGLSVYADKLNKKVASEEVTIVDSGIIDRARGALNVDDEGTPTQRTVLVDKGILTSYLHDKISAKHYGLASTGSGRRESYAHYPQARMRCTYMENGPHNFDDLLTGIKYGIFCNHFTNGQVFIGQGDYTFYVKSGFLIEDGKLSTPIKDVNLIGNGPDTLSKISMVANDFEMSNWGGMCGKGGQSVPVSLGMPSALVSGITVGGI